MADAFIQLPTDGSGKRLDAESLTVAAALVHRERMQIAGDTDVGIAKVLNTDPAATDYALVARLAALKSPATSVLTSAALAAGASVDLDGATIPAATTGKLLAATLASSVACKWIIKTRDGAVLVTIDTVFSGGLPHKPVFTWFTPNMDFATLAGAGVDENFRVTVTNLDDSRPADVYATLFWNEL